MTDFDSWLLRQQWEYEDQQEEQEQIEEEEEEEDDWLNDPNNVMSRHHY
jgi:hypothetical protein